MVWDGFFGEGPYGMEINPTYVILQRDVKSSEEEIHSEL